VLPVSAPTSAVLSVIFRPYAAFGHPAWACVATLCALHFCFPSVLTRISACSHFSRGPRAAHAHQAGAAWPRNFFFPDGTVLSMANMGGLIAWFAWRRSLPRSLPHSLRRSSTAWSYFCNWRCRLRRSTFAQLLTSNWSSGITTSSRSPKVITTREYRLIFYCSAIRCTTSGHW
jgi:hypothetical protein